MRNVATYTFVFCFACCHTSAALAADGNVRDQFEEKTVARSTERVLQFQNTERGQWVKELEYAFPGEVSEPKKKEDYLAWFKLLSGTDTEWKRASAPNPRIAALFDRVVEELRLGPVPAIQSQEFIRYVDRELIRDARRAQQRLPDPKVEADKIFRVLDGNGDGLLEREEMTTKLREERNRADTDLNGRVDKEEYRVYFQYRVRVGVETAPKDKPGADSRNIAGAKSSSDKAVPVSELPEWFTELDRDTDMQVALHEWRKAGRLLDAFMEMDLDEDGLLTRDEYLRFVEAKEKEKAAQIDPPPESKSVKQ